MCSRPKCISAGGSNRQQTGCSSHLVSPRDKSSLSSPLHQIKIFLAIRYQLSRNLSVSRSCDLLVTIVFVAIYSGRMSIVRRLSGIEHDKSAYFQTDVNTV